MSEFKFGDRVQIAASARPGDMQGDFAVVASRGVDDDNEICISYNDGTNHGDRRFINVGHLTHYETNDDGLEATNNRTLTDIAVQLAALNDVDRYRVLAIADILIGGVDARLHLDEVGEDEADSDQPAEAA